MRHILVFSTPLPLLGKHIRLQIFHMSHFTPMPLNQNYFAPSDKVYILGGLSYSPNITDPAGPYVLNQVSMSDIPMYDTVAGTWVNITGIGDIPSSRRGHTAVVCMFSIFNG